MVCIFAPVGFKTAVRDKDRNSGIYHTLLDRFELGWGILLGDARGGDATRRPVVGLTIGIAFRCLGGNAGVWNFMCIFGLNIFAYVAA